MTPDEAAKLFSDHTLWSTSPWLATTYQWDPRGVGPPVMGLVFDDWTKGVAVFKAWVDALGQEDADDDLRVAIIEGDVPNQTAGYTVRLSPSLNEYLEPDDPERLFIGQVCRMHPQYGTPGQPDLLARFKAEYAKHGEYMLCPVVERDDGQLYMGIHQGIIKHELILRRYEDLAEDEPDMLAVRECDDAKVAQRAIELMQRMWNEADGDPTG